MKMKAYKTLSDEMMMKNSYFESVIMVERLYRLFLDVIKAELHNISVLDINNIQCLVLYNIGTEKMFIGEIAGRGYYLGSNVFYNLRKLIKNQYVDHMPCVDDRRFNYIKLSPKGLDLFHKIDALLKSHSDHLEKDGVSLQEIKDLGKTLHHVESVLKKYIVKIK